MLQLFPKQAELVLSLQSPELPSRAVAVASQGGIAGGEGGVIPVSHPPQPCSGESPGWDVWGCLEILHVYLTHPPKQLLA